ncbi:MAG TPA: peptidase C15 [Coleofasciculaceae cyanobacterium]|jgi:pyroglutamyl-peptidase
MSSQLLLTSFQTWLPHQSSNSADDLLKIIQKQPVYFNLCYFLRKLPVNTELAAQQVIKSIKIKNPQGIICCGMAESRDKLTLESNAMCGEDCLVTNVKLDKLIACLNNTKISHHAGNFVCEGLYYQVLKYIYAETTTNVPCIFVHIPIINADNRENIQHDFIKIIRFIHSAKN